MRVSGDARPVLQHAGDVRFETTSGDVLLHYGKLAVLDADGRSVPSRLEVAGDRLSIVTDDRAARYPLLVDPLITAPDWSTEPDQVEAFFGVSVAGGGDLDCDGIDDIVVGAEDFSNGQSDEGAVFVFYGSASGPSAAPDWMAESNQADSRFGLSVAVAGDVDGDGCDDLVIGAPEYENDTVTQLGEGSVFVFYGPLDAGGARPVGNPANADWKAESNQEGAQFGYSVATAGKTNNDLADDIIIGAPAFTVDQSFDGGAFVYRGSVPSGLDKGIGRNPGTPANYDWRGDSNQVDSFYGSSVASGDITGDGYDDVIVAAFDYEAAFDNEGRVFLYVANANGSGLQTTVKWTFDGGRNDAHLGSSVASAGDVNGDGLDDVLIGAQSYANGQFDEGSAFVFHGVASGLLGALPAWTGEMNQGEAYLGIAVASAGDVNADGYDDILVGADEWDGGDIDEGGAFLYYGTDIGLSYIPAKQFEIDLEFAELGNAVASAGDVNDDGYDDVIIGSDVYYNPEVDEGAAFVYFGCTDEERDGVCQLVDNCPDLENADQLDTDFDGLGNVCDPCEDADLDLACDVPRVIAEWQGPGEEVLVEFGSFMLWYPNVELVNPGFGLDWTEFVFDTTGWSPGLYGVGYETNAAPSAENLLLTTEPPNLGTVSVYTRAPFFISDKSTVKNMFLGVDYDDGYVAWINGVEVLRAGEMPIGPPAHNAHPAGHESSNGLVPDYTPVHDISLQGIPALQNGQNVLAIGVWNQTQNSSELVLVPKLTINRPTQLRLRYLANSNCCVGPTFGLDWTDLGFDDSSWLEGNFGIGYELGIGGDDLITHNIPPSYSVFTRTRFSLNPATVDDVWIGCDWADGYVVWMNGTELYRSPQMPGAPGTDPGWKVDPPPAWHDPSNGSEPNYGTLINVTSAAKASMFNGENVLAIGGYRRWPDPGPPFGTNRMILAPRVSINEIGVDNCPGEFNPSQSDIDSDDIGDACDPDIDGDTFLNGVDNCPLVFNNPQTDSDTDGIGNPCDSCPNDVNNDADADGVCVGSGYSAPKIGQNDNCPTYNPPADCDGLPGTPPVQCNVDGDPLGDECDPDIDGDTKPNESDNCVYNSNSTQANTDGDPRGNACDCAQTNNQSWDYPDAIDTLRAARYDLCADFSCLQSGGICDSNLDCVHDQCENLMCTQSGGTCDSDLDCDHDMCDDFRCTVGNNECLSDVECTADTCENRLCSEGGNLCENDLDCDADFCANMKCAADGVTLCTPETAATDCPGPGNFCVGMCSATPGQICINDAICDADFCGEGLCSEGGNPCTSDAVCTADFCEGQCTISPATCLSDGDCTAPQTDFCMGDCSIGPNTCSDDGDCTVPQTDVCQGSCTIGQNICSSDSACDDPAADVVFWQRPQFIGSVTVVYDTLRSGVKNNFGASATCVETDGTNELSNMTATPASGAVHYYLVRVENDCVPGNMGTDSAGNARTGKVCE
jgi:hypothetical protein